jgi:hypothetical protein
MKKIIIRKLFLSFLIGSFSIIAIAQKSNVWLEFGLTGNGGLGMITNKNIWNDQKTVNSTLSFCYGGGIKIGLNLSSSHEILINPEFGIKNQRFKINLDSIDYEKNIQVRGLDVSLLYRYHSENGGYVEIGPQFSTIANVSELNNGEKFDVSNNFNKGNISGVFGFGSNFVQSNAFTWTIGFRFVYGFKDLVSNEGGNGSSFSYPLNDGIYNKKFENYQPTKAVALLLHTEFNFDLGYFAKSNCKRGRVSFMKF